MKRVLGILAVMVLSGMSAFATPLTPQQALSRLTSMGIRKVGSAGVNSKSFELAAVERTESGDASLYIYNQVGKEGYLILAADDVAYPVVGYSDSGSFSEANQSPEFRYWLDEYSDQIEYAVANGLVASTSDAPQRNVIAPMVTTKWNQGNPFNYDCPAINGTKCVTGCVATAMAQVMNYWKYPAKGTGSKSLSVGGTTHTMDLAAKSFDWDNMRNVYANGAYTDAERDAVAYLMKACGFSVNMGYGTSASGAVSINVGSALINNFGYNPNISSEQRQNYTNTQWEELVYGELEAGRPVYYSGHSNSGGHAFVCDGYDGNGFYHFNWGWGGSADGYFRLQALDPDSRGIGGGAGGYNIGQAIIAGVQPDMTGESTRLTLTMNGLLSAYAEGSKVYFKNGTASNRGGWFNQTYSTLTGSLCAVIRNQNNQTAASTIVSFNSVNGLKTNYGYYTITAAGEPASFCNFTFPESLGNGTYIVTLAFKEKSAEQPIPLKAVGGQTNSFKVVKSGSTLTIPTIEEKSIDVLSAELLSTLYYECPVKIRVKLQNPTDVELTQVLGPLLYTTEGLAFRAEGPMVTLQPGETQTVEWATEFELESSATAPTETTSYIMYIADYELGNVYDYATNVTMQIVSGTPTLSSSGLKIENATATVQNVPARGNVPVYNLESPENMEMTFNLKNTGSFFGGSVGIAIFDATNGGSSLALWRSIEPGLIDKNQTQTIKVNGSFTSAQEGVPYMIYPCYLTTAWKLLSADRIFFKWSSANSGVENVSDIGLKMNFDEKRCVLNLTSEMGVESLTVTNMAGVTVANLANIPAGKESMSLIELPKGVYVVTAVSNQQTQTTKIVIR